MKQIPFLTLLSMLILSFAAGGCGTEKEPVPVPAVTPKPNPPNALSLGAPGSNMSKSQAMGRSMAEDADRDRPGTTESAAEPINAIEGVNTLIKKGESARPFTAVSHDGVTVSLGDLKGKYILIDFWASWCMPCRKELPFLLKLNTKYSDEKKFKLIGISLDKSDSALKKYVADNKMTWLNILDKETNSIASLYGIRSIPFTVLIDPDGRVIATRLRGPAMIKELEGRLGY
ncbi:TlpA family protein disulfide reductase [bacterium]|nr:TlpA family protein disulfide reductase [candidate division CSSED10-310 bacterium]